MELFTAKLNGWDSWGRIFQSIPTFEPLIKYIFKKEKLPFSEIEHCTPGTNAVFKVGNYVIKIFAPKESGIDSTSDFHTESFAIARANKLSVPVPKLIASGSVQDRYEFAYMILEHVNGTEINKVDLSFTEKVKIGQKLRKLTDSLNTPCPPFNDIDVIHDQIRQKRWEKYPERFKKERLDYIQSHHFGDTVFVHGDLNGDNILITPNLDLHIIDFADAVLAPPIYEEALVALELFRFDQAYMQGYFGQYNKDEITDICFNGILIHDFGGDIIQNFIGQVSELESLEKLKRRILEQL
ncbi:aminoglycoside phosphotransferase family protein [Bacillus niameyensis]|uniref:aminoglycoside phosphotransferase family protein n=1 Tax=Bacillus niameyensis TaxID=1522308 RepID=UPI0007845BCD|nr:aminoglycoside phosphotransferase family protein [Bacillus niameyensis]